MAAHGWDGKGKKNFKAPLILQETNEEIYTKNGLPDVYMIEQFRRIIAEAISAMLIRIKKIYDID